MDERNPLKRPSGIDMSIQEQRQSYDKLEEMIKSMGDLKSIVNNKQAVLSILTSYVDRHLLWAFFEEINKLVAMGEITPADLTLLRSGWLVEQIINLEALVNQAGREIFPFEIGDKLNYITLLRDIPSLNATFANPILAQTINNAKDSKTRQQLLFWTGSALPLETKLKVAETFLKAGNTDFVMRILQDTTYSLTVSREREEAYRQREARTR